MKWGTEFDRAARGSAIAPRSFRTPNIEVLGSLVGRVNLIVTAYLDQELPQPQVRSKKFCAIQSAMSSQIQAEAYSAVRYPLPLVCNSCSDDGRISMARM